MAIKTLSQILNIEHPILLAPMFLVSNTEMILSALEMGCTGAIPAHNYRTEEDLRKAIQCIKEASNKPFGINLIVNRSNPKYRKQLQVLLDMQVDYIITSLGNPKEVIKECKPLGIKVFCDVVDVKYARIVEDLGADAVIAVNSQAGGHCGGFGSKQLLENLQKEINIPIISAGGVTNSKDIEMAMNLGAAGVSVGTIFIASIESPVSEEYKAALIRYGAKDIVKTTKLTGSPLTVINTPYVQKIGTRSNILEWLINHSPQLKKYAKMLLAWRGMAKVKKSAFKAAYDNVWCAGPAIDSIREIRPVKEIIKGLINS
ncbi:NAD(P)H-dependent flavin oxidoreductase [Marinifilum caeruleilacunae]|uniref:Nitronate monooxygenase n=1 Tax=Marinifilum caeruleilacunae TaxID=2499076 RepID=A0ABX1WPZ4_9BACT|nr:nitronate monooxygenase [Marinifilum caeruleilacunae]NOU58185.1 nitronate monooxygenase [Marinifilum caeruleilacunae]